MEETYTHNDWFDARKNKTHFPPCSSSVLASLDCYHDRFWALFHLENLAIEDLQGSSKLHAPKINPCSQIRFPITYVKPKVCASTLSSSLSLIKPKFEEEFGSKP